MAKTLLEGSAISNGYTLIYTCPSDKYAKITVLYLGDSGNDDGIIEELSAGNSNNARYAKLFLDRCCIIGGGYPFSGIGYGSGGIQGSGTAGMVHYSNFDGNLIAPPGGVIEVSASVNGTIIYSMLIEEIDKTTIEA